VTGLGRCLRTGVAALATAGLLAAAAAAAVSSPGTAILTGIPQKGTVLGDPAAPLTLLQYEDLGCEHCLEFMEAAFPAIVREYVRPGKLKVDFRGLGIVTPASEPALRYALAAGRQNRLWQVVALYYENQGRLNELADDAGVTRLVRGVKGLDVPRLLRDARSAAVTGQIRAVVRESVARKVEGTPWFLLRRGAGPVTRLAPEAYDAESFRMLLDEEFRR